MASTSADSPVLSEEEVVSSGEDSSEESGYDLEVEEDSVLHGQPTWLSQTAGLQEFPFTGNYGFCVPVPNENEPAAFFSILLDDVFLEFVVKETNKCALEVLRGDKTMPQSRIRRWKDLTVDELKVFLALLFHTGHIRLSRLEDYWRTDDMYNLSFFRKYMSRDRFILIFRCLHFSSHQTEQVHSRLGIVAYVVEYFNNKMNELYYPSRELTIDEPIFLWRGSVLPRQDIESKGHKNGIRFYSLSEPQGLTVRMKLYTGRNDSTSGKEHASKVVMEMMSPYLGKGHSLFVNNVYSEFPLASKLLTMKTYMTGTLLNDCKHLPKEVITAKLNIGETVARYAEGVVVAKWNENDKIDVLYMSTEFDNTMGASINKRGVLREKPLPLIKYNSTMKGVDRADQIMSYYPCDRKTMRWHKKAFVHVVQVMMTNTWSMYKLAYPDKNITLYDYRHAVIKSLLPASIGPPAVVSTKKRPNHVLSRFPPDANGKRPRKRCRVCSKEGKRTEIAFFCPACPEEPGLCPVRCFDIYHESL